MSRTADYTIQGFLYQFNKTLLEILSSPDDAVITIEGIVEDIDIETSSMLTAIQCKYHETQKYTPGKIYKPLIEMMHHFYRHHGRSTKYILFTHFSGDLTQSSLPVTKEVLEQALQSGNLKLAGKVADLTGNIDLDAFLKEFSAPVGPSFDVLVKEVHQVLQENGIPENDIDVISYPNAINFIATLSSKHEVEERKITKKKLLSSLHNVKKTVVSRWTMALKMRKQILEAKRKELKLNLDKNSRRRYFVVHADSLENDFESEIVLFVKEYCDKYYFKQSHIEPPLFCFNTTLETFQDIQFRLHRQELKSTDGYVGSKFDRDHFFRKPMRQHHRHGVAESEFSLRILHWDQLETINYQKAQDLFIIGSGSYNDWDSQDVNVEVLAAHSFKEIKYIFGISHVYE